jgi:hypothetical protein
VLEGTIDEKARTDVIAVHFKETPARSAYDWHPDPEPQFDHAIGDAGIRYT